jgi:FG-GAP-like repeat/FG-GAP repeat
MPDVSDPRRRFVVALCALASVGWQEASAAPQTPSLVTYAVGAQPRSVAVADLNKDGRRDVVVTNSGDGTVTILVGVGSGRLQALAPVIPCGDEPSDVDAVDIDRDGDIDLVIANHETSRISVLLNDGSAKFRAAPGSPFDSGARPHVHGLATGDFNGDGWIDVSVESADTKEVRILQGSPRGLTEAIAVPVGTMPYYRLGSADVTGDGIPDVLVPGHGDNTVRLVVRGNSGLATSPRRIALSEKPWMVVGDDVNGDERNDIIVVHSDGVGVWLATSQGFSPSPGSPFRVAGATEAATGDLDGDGIADVAIGPWDEDEVTIIEGGKLTVRKVRACARPIGLAIADLDGDKRGELLAVCANESRLVVLRWHAPQVEKRH